MPKPIFITSLAVLLSSLGSPVALAEEVTSQDITKMTDSLHEIRTSNTAPVDCDPTTGGVLTAKPTCSSLTDSICTQLIDPKNDGNLSFKGGKILFGKSDKSELSAARRLDLQALLDHESRLPDDLRKKGAPVLAKLRAVLKKETDSKAWYRELGDILTNWGNVMDDVANARAEAKQPELKKIKVKDLTVEQQALYATKGFDVSNEILKAKYETSPNWKRVERLFKEAKEDLRAQVEGLNISSDLKERMLSKLRSVELSLPLSDPRLLGADSACATTQKNAFYEQTFGKFTVCAGLFNSSQNDGALYTVIAHEISHSIDPFMVTDDEYRMAPVGRIASRMAGADGAVYSCEEWERIRKGPLSGLEPVKEPQSYAYRTLTDCFYPGKELKPFSAETVTPVAQRFTSRTISSYADWQAFTDLAQPTIQKNGKTLPNPYYMRPDRELAKMYGNFPIRQDIDTITPQVFTQSLACQKENEAGNQVDYAHATLESQKKMFTRAIEETKEVQKAIYLARFSLCGRECPSLVDDEISRNAEENFADWLAMQSLPRFLKRQKTLEEKRDIAALSFVLMCPGDTAGKDAPWLTEIEKQYSLESHPDGRKRRLSVFTEEVATEVGCQRDEDVLKGDSKCGL